MNKNNNSRGVSGVNMPGGLPGMSAARPTQRPMSMEEMLKNIDKAVEKLEKEEKLKQNINMKETSVGRINPVKMPANMVNDSSINPLNSNLKVSSKPIKQNDNKVINSADFAAKITNKVNQTVKEEQYQPVVENKAVNKSSESNTSKSSDYVTDDQFFDDFFADDDD